MRRVGFTFGPQEAESRAARGLAARASSVTAEVKQLTVARSQIGAGSDYRSCWASPRHTEHKTEKLRKLSAFGCRPGLSQAPDTSARLSAIAFSKLHNYHHPGDERVYSWHEFAESPRRPSSRPYLGLKNGFSKEENLIKAEMILKEKTVVEVKELKEQIKQAQIQQEQLLADNRHLYTEKTLVQAENKFFLEYLTNKTEEYKRQPKKLWNNFLQKSGEIERHRQESASKYAKQISVLKAELLQKEKIQFNLKQQLEAMRGISITKEKQEAEVQTLQNAKKKAETKATAKIEETKTQLLQEKALLEKQLSEPDVRQLGKKNKREVKRKNQALEWTTKQYTLEFYRGINRESQQLQKKILQLLQQCQELEASQSQLKYRKQQLQQEQWYLECLIRGRQRMQRRHNWCLQGQDAPKINQNIS
ncbi:coiled-coil domain-containing protein 121 [Tamandua tetradactyla]|uniref:coiled-coil domain-containing protein 121 n=1 Tax=Tamandua tetradactyla TaxID=48850 RepID=UPI004053FD8B